MNLTQKISQMTPKGADLDATDLIEVSTIVGGSYVTKSITGQELIDAIPLPPTGLTVGTTPIASGTVGRVLFQGTGNVLQQSSSLAYDDSTKAFSIVANQNATTSLTLSNNSTGSSSLITSTLISDTAVGNSLLYGSGRVNNNVNQYQTGASYIIDYQGPVSLNLSSTFASGSNSGIRFWTASSTSNGVERMRIASTGNVLINTTTDAGFRLDVNGTARFVAPNTYAITYDTNGNFNAAGAYSNFSLTNAAGSLRAKLNNDGPNGTLTLYQNATGYIFLNGAQSGNNSYIATALSIGNQSAANASSILELTSTTKGFLPPRMTTTQRNAIASPAAGLVVYDNTDNKHYGYNGTTWNAFY